MNRGSASNVIQSFCQMMDGERYTRTINSYTTDYFLTKIYSDNGKESLKKAISAVEKHVAYYESKRSSKLREIPEIIKRHSKLLGEPKNLKEYEKTFLEEVKKSLKDSTENRRKRLKAAETQPKKVVVSCEIFVRNPDVVAEVLYRANGLCERCKKPAPFLRKSNQSPYLEVHHKTRLADGGEDTEENSIALCPNCHRELHFGV